MFCWDTTFIFTLYVSAILLPPSSPKVELTNTRLLRQSPYLKDYGVSGVGAGFSGDIGVVFPREGSAQHQHPDMWVYGIEGCEAYTLRRFPADDPFLTNFMLLKAGTLLRYHPDEYFISFWHTIAYLSFDRILKNRKLLYQEAE